MIGDEMLKSTLERETVPLAPLWIAAREEALELNVEQLISREFRNRTAAPSFMLEKIKRKREEKERRKRSEEDDEEKKVVKPMVAEQSWKVTKESVLELP